jgi:hypothetical protein
MQPFAIEKRRSPMSSPVRIRHILAASVLAVCLAPPVAAQTTSYQYQGNTFTTFSCGPFVDSSTGVVTGTANCSTPAPTNVNTSYDLSDFVSATLSFDNPLPANMPLGSVTGHAGFQLTLSDGHQTVATPITSGQGLIATVATDAGGNIVEWRLILNTGGVQNGGVSTQRFTNSATGTLVQSDMGTLSCCDPAVAGDFGRRSGQAGVWTVSGSTPDADELVENLIDVIADPDTLLTSGQVSSLSDKLLNALASIQAGQYKQAVNQLQAFIATVRNQVKTGKVNTATGAVLVAAASTIITVIQSL